MDHEIHHRHSMQRNKNMKQHQIKISSHTSPNAPDVNYIYKPSPTAGFINPQSSRMMLRTTIKHANH